MLLLLGILAAHLGIGDCCSGGTWFVSSVQGRHQQQRQLWSVRLFSLVVLSVAVLLQGCEVDLPHHSIGNWRKQPDYLVAYEFVPPDKSPSTAVLNSCSDQDIPDSLRCSGQGYCKEWSLDASWKAEVSFCECNRDWADPECRTQRKSQIVVFLCSLFGGFLGLDYLYLGIPILAFLKLVTLGGLGFWWLLDIVRTGSGPVYAHNYRVASDLPHWAFVLSTVTIFSLAGFYAAIHSYLSFRKRKREDLMKLQESEEIRHLAKMEPILESPSWHGGRFGGAAATPWRSSLPPPGWEFGGYGATLQGPPPPQRGAHCAGLGGWVHAGGM